MVQQEISHNYLYFYYDSENNTSASQFRLELKTSFMMSVDNYSTNDSYVIVNSYEQSSILISIFTEPIHLDSSLKIDIDVPHISTLVVNYNSFRYQTFIFIKQKIDEDDQRVDKFVICSNDTSFIVYETSTALQYFDYAVFHGGWLYKILSPSNYNNEGYILRRYDRTLENDDYIQKVNPKPRSKIFKLEGYQTKPTVITSTNLTLVRNDIIDTVQPSQILKSNTTYRDKVALYLGVQNTIHDIDGFEGGNFTFNKS